MFFHTRMTNSTAKVKIRFSRPRRHVGFFFITVFWCPVLPLFEMLGLQ